MFDTRYVRALLILVSSLLLLGSQDFNCSTDSSSSSSNGNGSSGIRIRVGSEQKISANSGRFNGNLNNGDQFGSAVAAPGDLETDGVRDLVVGAPLDDDGGNSRGALWVLFMDSNGQVDQEREISSSAGSFGGNLDNDDLFGSALAGIGDLNTDGAFDLAVGAPGSDDGGTDQGAVWILFLNAAGGVRQEQNISDGTGGFGGQLDNDDRFGSAIADIGDINGDGIRDLAVGAPNDDDGSSDAGAVWILMMKTDGRVASWQKISRDEGRFNGNLNANDHFGAAIAGVGDLDNDGIPDLAVAAPDADEGGTDRGSVWILFLDASGRVRQEQEIADGTGGFDGNLNNNDRFGGALANITNVGGSGSRGLAVGAPNDNDGSSDAGAVWILTLQSSGRVDSRQKISRDEGGFGGNLDADDRFGAAIVSAGDLDNNGAPDLAVGAPGDDDGGADQGAVWILFMDR